MGSYAFANASMVFYQGINHLLFGNLFLGIVEAIVLLIFWRKMVRGRFRVFGLMIGANYFSWFVGAFVVIWAGGLLDSALQPRPMIERAGIVTFVGTVLALIVTIILEYPFISRVMHKESPRRRRIAVCLIVQLITFPMVVAYYSNFGKRFSMYLAFEHDHSLSFVEEAGSIRRAWVHYIDYRDNSLYRVRLDGSEREKLATLGDNKYGHRMVSILNLDGTCYDLWFMSMIREMYWEGTASGPTLVTDSRVLVDEAWLIDAPVVECFAIKSAIPTDPHRPGRMSQETILQKDFLFAKLTDLDPAIDSWHIAGLLWGDFVADKSAANSGVQTVTLKFETPWYLEDFAATEAAVLPGGFVVLQLGYQSYPSGRPMIVVIDLENRKLGLLAEGGSPVVSLDDVGPD